MSRFGLRRNFFEGITEQANIRDQWCHLQLMEPHLWAIYS